MDIRTKLVFSLVAVSIASMLVLGTFAYGAARDQIRDLAMRKLDAVAESKQRHLERVLIAWRDRTSLVASRTQLRLSLHKLQRNGDPTVQPRIQRILADAHRSVPTVERIAIFDEQGKPVAWTGEEGPGEPLPQETLPHAANEPVFRGIEKARDGSLRVRYLAPLHLEGEWIGALELVLDARELTDVTGDYTGLGRSGETLIARRAPDGSVEILNRVRHAAIEPEGLAPPGSPDPALEAVEGREAIFREGVDYRGEEVWAATRTVRGPGWGIVVKVDAVEEMAPVRELRETLIRLGLSLSALAIVTGTLLGFYFARPIRELAAVARRIRGGEHELRARTTSEDEVAELVHTFNEMIEVLVTSRRVRREPGDDGPPGAGGGERS